MAEPFEPKRFRILALSGGGYRALFTVRMLQRAEEHFGIQIADRFDLIVGTSAGALIAAALALRMPASQIEQLFAQSGTIIFPRKTQWLGFLKRWLLLPQYSTAGLEKVVCSALTPHCDPNTPIKEVKANLAMVAISYRTGKHRMLAAGDYASPDYGDISLKDAILASAAAPSYFSPVHHREDVLLDGGLVANAPELTAILHVMRNNRSIDISHTDVLSIGTAAPDTVKPISNWLGSLISTLTFGRVRKMVYLTLDAQEDLAIGLCAELIGDAYLRVDKKPNHAEEKVIRYIDCAGPRATRTLRSLADRAFTDMASNAYFISFFQPSVAGSAKK